MVLGATAFGYMLVMMVLEIRTYSKGKSGS
jgi:hypothetical protein